MLGVKSIGNATIIAYDEKPILSTDTWFGEEDDAYFGSWNLSHRIPDQEKQDMLACEYSWFSHGHPDHLNPNSLPKLKHQTILLPDHVGSRIHNDLENDGFKTKVLPDREWVQLSPRIKVYSVCDYIQDAAILIDVNGTLFVNMNDAGARGCFKAIQKIVAQYEHSYLLKLSGYNDADMINFFDESGNRIEPYGKHDKPQVGKEISSYAASMGVRNVIPSSSFHHYQRTDSIWANKFTTPIEAYLEGFDHSRVNYVEPFVWVDCDNHSVIPLNPESMEEKIYEPEHFGDNWTDELEASDVKMLKEYFLKKEELVPLFGFLSFKVGGKTTAIDMQGPKDKGITFEVPRHSLMTAVEWEFFDDLLIGNFMKTTLHGVPSLYEPNFNFYTTKLGDNGRAFSQEEVKGYMKEYHKRAKGELMFHLLEQRSAQFLRKFFNKESKAYGFVKSLYYQWKS